VPGPEDDPAGAPPTARAAAVAGFRAMVPLIIGMVPFGLVAGVAATEIGLPVRDAVGFSMIVFAGASQLAAIELLGRGASVAVAVATIVIVNLRMLMYGAALAPWFSRERVGPRLGVAYLLTDQAFAISLAHYGRHPTAPHRVAYYVGGALPLWAGWQVLTVVGALVGDRLPDELPLDFFIPLAFLALLVPAVHDRPGLAAAVTSGTVAVALVPLPANLGMVVAAVAGITAGVVADVRRAAA
jgi:predicted branched-subunit amino acid permease